MTEAEQTEETTKEWVDEAQQVVKSEGPLKGMLVNYVGQVLTPADGQVTVEMIVQTLASEFPDFLLVVARENWLRGYEQALTDVDNVEKEKAAALALKGQSKKPKKKAKKKANKSDERASKTT
tara:strand:- start:1588 stop:1956 length:369 start_codon:yes stop_codon:yes gene_type:complete